MPSFVKQASYQGNHKHVVSIQRVELLVVVLIIGLHTLNSELQLPTTRLALLQMCQNRANGEG